VSGSVELGSFFFNVWFCRSSLVLRIRRVLNEQNQSYYSLTPSHA
jgi:hypothetical protein